MSALPDPLRSVEATGGPATPGPDWDAVAELWEELPPQTLWRRHSDAVNARLVRRWLPASNRLLKTDLWDEATGEGLYPVLAERTRHLIGIDVSESIVSAASRRYPQLEALTADVRSLPFADGSVDAVLSNSTLDHFESTADIDTSLAELARVLRPGGALLITLDNPQNPLVGLVKALPHRLLNEMWLRLGTMSARVGILPYHVGATYGRASLLSALDRAGFDVEAETTLVHSPRLAAVVAGHLLERRAKPATQERFLGLLDSAEGLGRLPTRRVTAHFFGVRAKRR